MRLTEQQVETIRQVVRQGYGEGARIRLFGSRTRSDAIGGDVDLLVELAERAPLRRQIAVSAQLEAHLGLPVDVLATWPGDRQRPIVEIARLTGIPL